MELEEVKLILEFMSTLSGDATSVIYMWFALVLVKYLLTFSGAAGIGYAIYKLFTHPSFN